MHTLRKGLRVQEGGGALRLWWWGEGRGRRVCGGLQALGVEGWRGFRVLGGWRGLQELGVGGNWKGEGAGEGEVVLVVLGCRCEGAAWRRVQLKKYPNFGASFDCLAPRG